MLKSSSLALRLVMYLFLPASAILMTSEIYNYIFSKNIIVKIISEYAENIALSAQNKIEGVLDSAEKIPLNVSSALETGEYNKESIEKLLVSVVSSNSEAYGACIGFEPFKIDPSMKYYAR